MKLLAVLLLLPAVRAASRICDPYSCPPERCNASILHGAVYTDVTWMDRNPTSPPSMSTGKYIYNFIHGHVEILVIALFVHQVLTASFKSLKNAQGMGRHKKLGAYFAVALLPINLLFSTFLVISSSKHEEDPCAIHPVPLMYYTTFFAFGLCHHLLWAEMIIGSSTLAATEDRKRLLVGLHAASMLLSCAGLHECIVGMVSVPYESYLWESGLTISLFDVVFLAMDAANIYRLLAVGLVNKADENAVWGQHHSMNAIFLLAFHVGTWTFVITRNEYYFFAGDVDRWVKFACWLVPILATFGWKLPKLGEALLWPALPKEKRAKKAQ